MSRTIRFHKFGPAEVLKCEEHAAAQPAPWEHAGGEQDPARALAHSMRQAAQAVGAIAQSGDADLISKATAQLVELKRKLYQLLAES